MHLLKRLRKGGDASSSENDNVEKLKERRLDRRQVQEIKKRHERFQESQHPVRLSLNLEKVLGDQGNRLYESRCQRKNLVDGAYKWLERNAIVTQNDLILLKIDGEDTGPTVAQTVIPLTEISAVSPAKQQKMGALSGREMVTAAKSVDKTVKAGVEIETWDDGYNAGRT